MYVRIYWIITLIFTSFFTQSALSQEDCQNTWITQFGWNVLGGTLDPGPKTPLQCKASCISQPNSKGFDFDGANRCWIIFNGTLQQDTSNPPTVTHYDFLRGVNSCTASCNGMSTISWSASPNANVRGGTGSLEQTMLDCLKKCLGDDQCFGFDWDPNSANTKCWLTKISNGTVTQAIGVTHYEKACVDSGTRIVTARFFPPNQRFSSQFPTIPSTAKPTTQGLIRGSTTRTTTVGLFPRSSTLQPATGPSSAGPSYSLLTSTQPSGVGRPEDAAYVYIKGQAIKPAYIVLAGLGAGCIVLVIIAVVVLCCYPLRGDGDDYSYREKKHKQKGELHTRRPKTLTEEENIGMSTVTTAVNNNHTYNSNSYKKNSYNSGNDIKNHRLTNGSAETVDYKRPDSGDYNHHKTSGDYGKRDSGDYNRRSSGDYNKRESGGSIRKSGGYEEPAYDKGSRRGSLMDNAEDRINSMASDAKDEYHHARDSIADDAY